MKVYDALEAARLLPIPTDLAWQWLAKNNLIRDLAGHRVVCWDDVLACIKALPTINEPEAPVVEPEEVCAARALPQPFRLDQVLEALAWPVTLPNRRRVGTILRDFGFTARSSRDPATGQTMRAWVAVES